MATVTYTGRGGMRILTREDGFTTDLVCRPGIPVEVTDEDAEIFRTTPLRVEFTVDPPEAPEADATTETEAPSADARPSRTTGKAT